MSAIFHARVVKSADLLRVLAFVGTEDAPPWTDDVWRKLVAGSCLGPPERCLLVAETASPRQEASVTGIAVVHWVAGVAELESVVVAQAHRRQGVGRLLCQAAMMSAAQLGAAEMQLEVRASNVAALALYGECGFAEVGKRPAYYRNPLEDAVLMTAPLQVDSGALAQP